MLLLRSWQDAHQVAEREPERARRLMAQREQTSVAAFSASEQGLGCSPLAKQEAMLRPDGLIARNLQRVQAVQQHIGLSRSGAPLPPVTDRLVHQALHTARRIATGTLIRRLSCGGARHGSGLSAPF